MKRRATPVLTLFILWGWGIKSQSPAQDSLQFATAFEAWKKVNTDRQQSAQQIQMLEELARNKEQPYFKAHVLLSKTYHNSSFESKDSAIALGTQAIRIFQMMGDRKQEAYLLLVLGGATWLDTRTSISYFLRALQIEEARGDSASIAKLMSNLSIQYHKAGNMDSAFYCANRCLSIGEALNSPRWRANAYSRLQYLHGVQGNREESIACGLKVLEFSQQTPSVVTLAASYHSLAASYLALGDHQKGLEYGRLAVKLSLSSGISGTLAESYRTLGTCFRKMGLQDSAEICFKLALPEAIKAQNPEASFYVLTSLAELSRYRDDIKSSWEYLQQARSWWKSYGPSSEPKLFIGLAEHFSMAGQHDSAVYFGERGFHFAQKNGLVDYSISASMSLYNTYKAVGDYQNALKYYSIHQTLTDSVSSEETKQRVAELQAKYNTQRKQDEITRLTSEKRIQDLTLLQQVQLIALGRRDAEKKQTELELLSQEQQLSELTANQMSANVEKQKLINDQMASKNELLTKDYELQHATLSRQRVLRNAALVSSLLLLLVGVLFYARYRSRKKYALALEGKNRLIESEKQKAIQSEFYKSQFLANMSHEIRTPLHAITGMINVLNEKDPRDDQQAYLNVMRKSSESLMGVINNVLDISKIEAGKVVLETTRFSLLETLQNIINLLHANAMSKNIALKSSSQNLPDFVMGDQVRLTQVLINLIGNAIKFTEAGHVAVEMKAVAGTNGNSDKINIECAIEDTGIGIPYDRQDSIFQNFTQADQGTTRKFGGTGLGLSISKQLIELQGGTISLRSEPGMGTTFRFSIPYQSAAQVDGASEAPIAFVPGDHENLNILIVEDNAYNRIVASETLGMLLKNAHIDMAENGIIALQMLEQDDYDVVFMDVQMPLLDGYQTTQSIRSELPEAKRGVPIIGVTANATPEDRAKCLRSGMNEYLTKPFYPADLMKVITSVRKSAVTV
jgi:signal transduction histidine kinase/tetratricopeptide (TPR) repeat protein